MPSDMEYDLRVTFRVKLKKWRVDEQDIKENREWSLKVYDRNLGEWTHINHLNRPGEDAYLESVEEI
jgi:hypothetical protein